MARNFGWMMIVAVVSVGVTMWAPGSDAEDAPGSAEAATAQEGAGVSGTWKYSFEGFNGTQEVVIKLQQQGTEVIGTISGFGGSEDAISEGKVTGDTVSFKTVRDFGDQTATTTYSGTVSGDSFKGKAETTFSRDFEAKRSTE